MRSRCARPPRQGRSRTRAGLSGMTPRSVPGVQPDARMAPKASPMGSTDASHRYGRRRGDDYGGVRRFRLAVSLLLSGLRALWRVCVLMPSGGRWLFWRGCCPGPASLPWTPRSCCDPFGRPAGLSVVQTRRSLWRSLILLLRSFLSCGVRPRRRPSAGGSSRSRRGT